MLRMAFGAYALKLNYRQALFTVFEFHIEFIRGKDNSLPDLLSREFLRKIYKVATICLNQASIKLLEPLILRIEGGTHLMVYPTGPHAHAPLLNMDPEVCAHLNVLNRWIECTFIRVDCTPLNL